MPVEFISATHTTASTEPNGAGRRFGFDVDYTRRFVRALDDGGFASANIAVNGSGRRRPPGTPQNVGCELLSIRGWDPLNDAIGYARHVVPLVRQELAHRPAAPAASR